MVEVRPIGGSPFEVIADCFREAFRDYIVPMRPTDAQLSEMLRRRGWERSVSVGAFEEGRLIGFTLNALRDGRGYDSGTGVVASHRRRGLASQMMTASTSLLREAGASEYVLEVLTANTAAVALYQREGFKQSRQFQCWSFPPGAPEARSPRAIDFPEVETWWDIQPSWQNSTESIRAAGDEMVVIGDDSSYLALFPSNGDVAQTAVRPDARRKGRGRSLLLAAAAIAAKPLRIINVDDSDRGVSRFLEGAGAVRTVMQFEMTRGI